LEDRGPRRHKGLNIWKATLFVAGGNAGGALLALPFALKGSGWYGLAMLILLAIDSTYAGVVQAKCWTIVEERWPEYRGKVRYPYPAMGLMAYGPKMR
jgi:amino acid permease